MAGLLEYRLEKDREHLEEAREAVHALCDPVEPPQDTKAYLHWFCAADTSEKDALRDNEPPAHCPLQGRGGAGARLANLAKEMPQAGYAEAEIQTIRQKVKHFEQVREEVKLASGDDLNMKVYEPAMRHLLDTYIQAEDNRLLSAFEELGLVDLVVQQGPAPLDQLTEGIRVDRDAMAETIENNLRKLIIDEHPVNPKYYEKLSELLDALIQERREQALEYEEYLERLVERSKKVKQPAESGGYPPSINSPARRALYDNLKGGPKLGAIATDLAEPGTGQEASAVPGVPRRTRDGAPPGAPPQ